MLQAARKQPENRKALFDLVTAWLQPSLLRRRNLVAPLELHCAWLLLQHLTRGPIARRISEEPSSSPRRTIRITIQRVVGSCLRAVLGIPLPCCALRAGPAGTGKFPHR